MNPAVTDAGGVFQREPTAPVGVPQICQLLGIDEVAGQVTGVTLSSASVHPGDLYAALPGARTHGARFAADAVSAGAAAVLTDQDGLSYASALPVPVLVCPDPRAVLGAVSALVYGFPAHSLRTFGITGTNGKTTVTYMLAAALQALGLRSGLIGTTGTFVGSRRLPTVRTTPEAPDVQALLSIMVEAGMDTVAMEVSSHALALGRVDALVFDVAAFTNLSPDHLDFHPSMREYFEAKASLFTKEHCRRGVVNVDDDWGRELARTAEVPVLTYGLAADADWTATEIVAQARGSRFRATHPEGTVQVRVGSPGTFNVANALCAVAVLTTSGFDALDAAQAVSAFGGVPGRMEVVTSDNPDEPAVIVDYAHTPDAVERALSSVRPLTQGKIWCVLGCGGDRDSQKRPVMGRIAAQHADHLIVTDDNPRSEDPAAIRAAVLEGARAVGGAHVREEGDRGTAIHDAIAAAGPHDCVMILGKGHEAGQEVAGVIHDFDDRRVARDALGSTR